MRISACLLLIFAAFVATAAAQNEKEALQRFRERRDSLFRDPVFSPLPRGEIGGFRGLKYFDFDAGFVVKAVLERAESAEEFKMPVSSGSPRRYFRFGILRFRLAGSEHSLMVFRSESSARQNGSLFLPFRDETNGTETYGAGRYIDITAPAGSEVTIDFNYAYSPSCAFSDEFACPLPPKENFLRTPVRAGEKIYRERTESK